MPRKKMIPFLCFPFLLSALLSGCMGSQFVVEDANTQDKFPDLHDVPERPTISAEPRSSMIKEQLSQDHEKDLSENEALRKRYGL